MIVITEGALAATAHGLSGSFALRLYHRAPVLCSNFPVAKLSALNLYHIN